MKSGSANRGVIPRGTAGFFIWCLLNTKYGLLFFFGHILVSLMAALTEGFGASIIIPIFTDSDKLQALDNIPLLSHLFVYFKGMGQLEKIRAMAVIIMMLALVRSSLMFLSQAIPVRYAAFFQKSLMTNLFARIMNVRFGFIQGVDSGNLISAMSYQPVRIWEAMRNVSQIVTAASILIVYSLLMAVVSYKTTILAVSFMVAILWINRSFAGKLKLLGEQVTKADAEFSQVCVESVSMIKQIQLSAAEDRIFDRLNRRLTEYMRVREKSQLVNIMSMPVIELFAGGLFAVLLFFGSTLMDVSADILMGILAFFLFVFYRIKAPIDSINTSRMVIMNNIDALKTLRDNLIAYEENRMLSGDVPFVKLNEGIAFDKVSFSYAEDKGWVFKDIDAVFPARKMTAIVGPSGTGKTTLALLITRLYDPQRGKILVDGTDLQMLDVYNWRRKVGFITQDFMLFNDSVINNVRFQRPEATDQEVREALRMANALEFVEALPGGLDTRVGERGALLSHGQQQRIVIARALLAEPQLLILDEATSSLDVYAEEAIKRMIETIRHKCTFIVIAHRMSTIRNADSIIVMSGGNIVEQGGHEELIGKKGRYWEMLTMQQLDIYVDDAETIANNRPQQQAAVNKI